MIYSEFKKIKCIVLDVDGVLTDGKILMTEDGQALRSFNVKDGYAIQHAIKQGYKIFVLTGGYSESIKKRCEMLSIEEIHMGLSDKLSILNFLLEKYALKSEEVLMIGDDMPDYECMLNVGIAIAPSDAVDDIKKLCQYISTHAGGQGVVREIIEKVMKLQGTWFTHNSEKSI